MDALRLIAITDDVRDGADGLVARAAAAVRGGVTLVQLRLADADARDLVAIGRRLVEALEAPVVITSRADVALAIGAAGVYLGVDDIPAAALRPVVPAGFLIGASVSNDEEAARASGADYVGIGPVFPATRAGAAQALGLAEMARLARVTALPAIAIGGIDESTCAQATAAGAVGVAAIRAIFAAADPERAARALSSAIGS